MGIYLAQVAKNPAPSKYPSFEDWDAMNEQARKIMLPEHMKVALGWSVLAHNLRVLARREIKCREEQKNKKRKAA